MKPTAKEKRIFINKPYGIFLTFPMKYAKDRKINSLPKRHPELNIYVVFSNQLTRTSLYHWFTESGEGLQEIMKEKQTAFSLLLIELDKLMKLRNGR